MNYYEDWGSMTNEELAIKLLSIIDQYMTARIDNIEIGTPFDKIKNDCVRQLTEIFIYFRP